MVMNKFIDHTTKYKNVQKRLDFSLHIPSNNVCIVISSNDHSLEILCFANLVTTQFILKYKID